MARQYTNKHILFRLLLVQQSKNINIYVYILSNLTEWVRERQTVRSFVHAIHVSFAILYATVRSACDDYCFAKNNKKTPQRNAYYAVGELASASVCRLLVCFFSVLFCLCVLLRWIIERLSFVVVQRRLRHDHPIDTNSTSANYGGQFHFMFHNVLKAEWLLSFWQLNWNQTKQVRSFVRISHSSESHCTYWTYIVPGRRRWLWPLSQTIIADSFLSPCLINNAWVITSENSVEPPELMLCCYRDRVSVSGTCCICYKTNTFITQQQQITVMRQRLGWVNDWKWEYVRGLQSTFRTKLLEATLCNTTKQKFLLLDMQNSNGFNSCSALQRRYFCSERERNAHLSSGGMENSIVKSQKRLLRATTTSLYTCAT